MAPLLGPGMTRLSDYLDRTSSYLRASERRHLAEAEAFLDPDARFVFPGATFERLADVHAAASTLYTRSTPSGARTIATSASAASTT